MGHAHAHAHSHGEGEGTYFLDQLFTILVCGAIGLVAILMYSTGMLSRILAPMFFIWVLLGGVAIVVLAAIRAIAVWQLAGARRGETGATNNHEHSHSHSHSHGHDHAHDHEDCGHEHGEDCGHEHAHAHADGDGDGDGGEDHGHDHGWAPWRYMVLAIPVFLYFLDLPRSGFFSDRKKDQELSAGALQQGSLRKSLALLAGGMAYRKPEPRRLELGFNELTRVAAVPSRHEDFDGDIGVLRGQFSPVKSGSDREFTLFRVNMTCCAADAVFLETRIIAPDPVSIPPNQWVQVEGVISFQKNERGKWVPVITLKSNDDIRETEGTTNTNAF
jgi:hypothetical protein